MLPDKRSKASPPIHHLFMKFPHIKANNVHAFKLDYSRGSSGADGYFGSNTTSAVKAFQDDEGLTADGLAGNATKQTLYQRVYG